MTLDTCRRSLAQLINVVVMVTVVLRLPPISQQVSALTSASSGGTASVISETPPSKDF